MINEETKTCIVNMARLGNFSSAKAMYCCIKDFLSIAESSEIVYEIDAAALEWVRNSPDLRKAYECL